MLFFIRYLYIHSLQLVKIIAKESEEIVYFSLLMTFQEYHTIHIWGGVEKMNIEYLLCILGPVLVSSQVLSLIVRITLGGKYIDLHFTDEETEA